MAIVFIPGSTDGVGREAQSLLADGHQGVLHARSTGRTGGRRTRVAFRRDLSSAIYAAPPRSEASQTTVNAMGRMDAIIHNAGIYTERSRSSTPKGHAGTLAVNILLVYLSSG